VRGRLLEPIVTEQLDAALALDPLPTLMTLNGGGNDMLRPKADVGRLVTLTERVVERCAAAGVRLVLISGADPFDRLPFGKTVRRRAEELTLGVAALAAAHHLTLVDMFHDLELRRPGYWSADRLHLNAFGHQRVAGRVLAALGSEVSGDRNGFVAAEARGLLTEARYYREHVLPWVRRRLRGHSSGDTRGAKFAEWTVVAPSV
jgi:lysophospholipase L1-like esterase